MHRGVLYGVIAFGLVVGLSAFVCVLASGGQLAPAAWIFALLLAGLVLFPLTHYATRAKLHGARGDTLGVALLVFALLVVALGVVVGVVGKGPWLGAAAGLVGVGLVIAGVGWRVLRSRPHQRTAPDTIRWHE